MTKGSLDKHTKNLYFRKEITIRMLHIEYGILKMFTHSIPIDSRETPTTIRSRMLKELRQKEPLCMNAPYTVICKSDASQSHPQYSTKHICVQAFVTHRDRCVALDFKYNCTN